MKTSKAPPRPPPKRRIVSIRQNASRAVTPTPALPSKQKSRVCPECPNPDVREDNGQLLCFSCGCLISDSVIVNDVTFGEAPSGAALVQGTTVHEGQRYAKTAGTGFRHAGRTPEDAQQSSLRNAKEEMTRLANSLLITNIVDRAFRLYTIARVHHFHRPVLESVAICLYIVCRQTKGNTILLIDFAEKIRQNVFDLGSVYKKFVRAIGLEGSLEDIPVIEIEPLLYKFAKRLEFGTSTRQVANDAALILSRMNRDWMVTGRQPPALCGAALILAARMNNFRRSVREVVYVVKAGDATVMRRLWEFKRTRAGQMTVQQFRQYSHRLKSNMEPPSVYRRRESENLKAAEERERLESIDAHDQEPPSNARLLSDGFDIPRRPSIPSTPSRKRPASVHDPIDESSNVDETEKSSTLTPGPSKRRKNQRQPTSIVPFLLTEADLYAENELETEITRVVESHVIQDGEAFDVVVARSRRLAALERAKSAPRAADVADSETIGESEFADDDEVANCLLSAAEIEVKERIWVTANHDWLREQQEKMLDRALEEARGRGKKKNNNNDNKKRNNNNKMMMMTATTAGRGGGSRQASAVHDSPASTPAEASHRMLEKRSIRPAFSKHINYESLKKIYRIRDEEEEEKSTVVDSSREVSALPGDIADQEEDETNESEEEISHVKSSEKQKGKARAIEDNTAETIEVTMVDEDENQGEEDGLIDDEEMDVVQSGANDDHYVTEDEDEGIYYDDDDEEEALDYDDIGLQQEDYFDGD